MSNLTLSAGGDPARAADAQARPRESRGTKELGRAYRRGRLICACVHVTVSLDGRLGLAPVERRLVRLRFHEPLDDELRTELTRLMRRRGAAARRAVERIDPIEVVVDDPCGEPERVIGHLHPPHVRHGRLHDVEFELKRAR